MKKLLAITLLLALTLSFAACGDNKAKEQEKDKKTETISATSEETKVDYETQLWNAMSLLETIMERNTDVWEARCIVDSEVLEKVAKEGFSGDGAPISIALNDIWISEYGYEAYVTPSEDYVKLFLSSDEIRRAEWDYEWNGNCYNGYFGLLEDFVSEYILHPTPTLPYFSFHSGRLDETLSILDSKYELYGPGRRGGFNFSDDATYWFFMKDNLGIDYYGELGGQFYYGIKNGQVVFQGIKSPCTFRELFDRGDFPQPHKQQVSRDGGHSYFTAYTWQIENGYLSAITYDNTQNPANVTAQCFMFVKDLTYLSYF